MNTPVERNAGPSTISDESHRASDEVRDTSREAARVLAEEYRRMTPSQRLACALRLTHELELLAAGRIRTRYGEMSNRELRLRLGALRIERNLMVRAFGWDPTKRGY